MIVVLASKTYKAATAARKASTPVKTLPVTNTLKIKVHDGHMLFIPFAWEKRAELTKAVPARVEDTEWETCIPAKPFVDWLRASQLTPQEKKQGVSEQVVFTYDPAVEIVTIKAGNTRAQFKCISAQEFPT